MFVRVPLTSRLRKALFTVLLLALLGDYGWSSLCAFRASWLAARLERANLERAIALEPGNAGYHNLLGTNLFFAEQDVEGSLAQYNAAAALNPYVARYWLDLARAYLTAGDVIRSRSALARAVAVEPKTPDVLWEVGNDYLVLGATNDAFPYIRTALEQDPNRTVSALNLCWRTIGDVNLMLSQALPRRSDVYLSFVDMLLHQNETAAAAQVWSALLSLRQTVPPQRVLPYIEYLLAHREAASAAEAWRALPSIAPQMRPYIPVDNLIVNGQFANEILNVGFDWHYQEVPHVNVSLDDGLHDGERSLEIAFDGDTVNQAGIFQWLALHPHTHYEFSAWVRTSDLQGVTGSRLTIQEAYGSDIFLRTSDLLGTTPWKEIKGEFTTGNTVGLGLLKIELPATTHIRGTMWMTDLRLTKSPGNS